MHLHKYTKWEKEDRVYELTLLRFDGSLAKTAEFLRKKKYNRVKTCKVCGKVKYRREKI